MTDQPKFLPEKHPDDAFYDEAKIKIEERFKTSGMSGSEWRFSYRIELWRKGVLLAHKSVGEMNSAAADLTKALHIGLRELEDYGYEVIDIVDIPRDGICCQPGCSRPADRKYVKKKSFDKTGEFSKPNQIEWNNTIYGREFCSAHGYRGDCGLDDANSNYVCIEGLDWDDAEVDPAKISESMAVIIDMSENDDDDGSLQELIDAAGGLADN